MFSSSSSDYLKLPQADPDPQSMASRPRPRSAVQSSSYDDEWAKVFPVHETSDFPLVRCVRRVLLSKDETAARQLFEDYPYWYHENLPSTNQVFWTENHMITVMSSEYLIREFLREHLPHTLRNRVERFVNMKLSCGMAEFLSPVYLTYTLASLLNIHDFTSNITLKAHTRELIDNIAEQLLTFTTSDGCLLSPAGRTYRKFREESTNHHIHDFICFLMRSSNSQGIFPEERNTLMSECLSTTSYQPSQRVFQNFHAEIADLQIKASPTWQELMMHIEEWRPDTPLEDLVSYMWSHGAYFHPAILSDVIAFMDQQHIWNHHHFRMLRPIRSLLCCFSGGCIASVCAYVANSSFVRVFSFGSLLTDAVIHVHKEGDVIISALCGYNTGLKMFQQWPWIVNLAGAPVWASVCYTNTASSARGLGRRDAMRREASAEGPMIMPDMHLYENVLVVKYERPPGWCGCLCARNVELKLHWPVDKFDSHGVDRDWQWARRNHVAVAVRIKGLTAVCVVRDLKVYGESGMDMPTDTFLERLDVWVEHAGIGEHINEG